MPFRIESHLGRQGKEHSKGGQLDYRGKGFLKINGFTLVVTMGSESSLVVFDLASHPPFLVKDNLVTKYVADVFFFWINKLIHLLFLDVI